MRKVNAHFDLSAVPLEFRGILARLHQAGHEVWLVGGALRDHLLGRPAKDWDVATSATPQQVVKLFPRVIPIGLRHGTVQVHTPVMDVEVTSYTPQASPIAGILRDLERRDFTVNALAVAYPTGLLLDPHGGGKDLAARRLRAVGDAAARFQEDPLRTLRAARFVSTHGMRLARATFTALQQASAGLTRVAGERIREEMLLLLVGERVVEACEVLRRGRILAVVLPELLEGRRMRQNQFHRYDIYHHIVQTVHHSPRRERVRLAALLHDIAKPRVRRRHRGAFHFHGHAQASALLAEEIMHRWKMSNQQIQDIRVLTANHLLMDTDRWSDAAVRRLISRVGTALLDDLLDLAKADRLAHGAGHAHLEHLEQLRARIAAQLRQGLPLQVKDLAVNGHDVMRLLQLPPGPKVGEILRALHQSVLKHPEYNRRDVLLERVSDWNHR